MNQTFESRFYTTPISCPETQNLTMLDLTLFCPSGEGQNEGRRGGQQNHFKPRWDGDKAVAVRKEGAVAPNGTLKPAAHAHASQGTDRMGMAMGGRGRPPPMLN